MALTGARLGMLMIWLKGMSNLVGLKSSLVLDFLVPIAMISLGVDFAIHAMRRYREEKRKGYPPSAALQVGFAGVLGALGLVMLSDGIAFLTNIVSGIESVIGFAVGAGMAIIASFFVLGLGVPAVMMRLDAMRAGDSAQEKAGPNDARLRGRMAGLGKALAIAAAASVNGVGVIIMVDISPVVGIAVIAAFIIFGILLPAVVIRRRDMSRPKSAIAEVA